MTKFDNRFALRLCAVLTMVALILPLTAAAQNTVTFLRTENRSDGKVMLTANVLTSSLAVIDPKTDTLVATVPCDPGCHGVQWGAKSGGGYYAYVSSKFSNTMLVVDPDPANDGDMTKAKVVGRILLHCFAFDQG